MASPHHHHHHDQPVDNDPTPPPATSPGSPTPPAADAPAFSDLGVTFNDATRSLVGGLWQNVVEEGPGKWQRVKYTNDLTAVQTGLTAEVDAGQFSGATLNHVQTVLSDITTALSAANASVSGGGSFGSVAAAETALHNSHLDILNIVNNDPTLAGLAAQNGASGFRRYRPPFRTAPRRLTRLMPISRRLAPSSTTPRTKSWGVSTPTTPAHNQRCQRRHHRHPALIQANPTLFGGLPESMRTP